MAHLVACLMLCLILSNNSVQASVVQYETGTVVTKDGTINVGMVKMNIIIKIPPIRDISDVGYLRPCGLIHQFSTDLVYANLSISTAIVEQFSMMCKDFARLKKMNLAIRNYYSQQIEKAKKSMSLLRTSRSIFSFFRHQLNIGDYSTQLTMKRKLGALEDSQFSTYGELRELEYKITLHSERILHLENAVGHLRDIADNMSNYLEAVSNNINGKEILARYRHVMLHESLNSGIIGNQYMNILTTESKLRVRAITDLSKHYLPYDLITPDDLESVLKQYEQTIANAHPSLLFTHRSVHDYYGINNVHGIVKNGTFFIHIPLLLNFRDQEYDVFKLHPFYLPIPGNENAAMKLQHGQLVAVNRRLRTFFIPDEKDLAACVGTKNRLCGDVLPIIKHMDQEKPCELAILMNDTDLIKSKCDIGLFQMENVVPEIIQIGVGHVLVINPRKLNVYQQCDSMKNRIYLSNNFLIETKVSCFCWLTNEQFATPTFVYESCVDTADINTKIYDPIENLLYISLLFNYTDLQDLPPMNVLQLPKKIIDFTLPDETKILNLKHVISAQKNNFDNSVHNRLNSHDTAVANISIFKIFATFVPPLIIIIIITIICFLVKTKRIGQLVTLSNLVRRGEALPIDNVNDNSTIDLITDYITLAVLILIFVYCIIKYYHLLRTFIQTISLPFTECMTTRKNQQLKIILYIHNVRTYCYIYIDSLDLTNLPSNIQILGRNKDVKLTYHNSLLSSYITFSDQKQLLLKNTNQILDMPKAIAISFLQKYTVKTILASSYEATILVGANNVYIEQDIVIENRECVESSE